MRRRGSRRLLDFRSVVRLRTSGVYYQSVMHGRPLTSSLLVRDQDRYALERARRVPERFCCLERAIAAEENRS